MVDPQLLVMSFSASSLVNDRTVSVLHEAQNPFLGYTKIKYPLVGRAKESGTYLVFVALVVYAVLTSCEPEVGFVPSGFSFVNTCYNADVKGRH